MGVTYPPGQISKLGENLATLNRQPHITYVGHEGSKFYLAGPLAPVIGAQNGVALQKVKGLMPPFQHISTQGARQDGITWQDSVYDAGEIDMMCELSGMSTAEMRRVIRQWIGAWDAKKQGRLHVFTPEMGEWWTNVRQMKTISDELTYAWEQPGRQTFTWTALADDAFWKSFDSVAQLNSSGFANWDSDSFSRYSMGSNWDVAYKVSSGGGSLGFPDGVSVGWTGGGNADNRAVCRWNVQRSRTNTQKVQVTIRSGPEAPLGASGAVELWARMNNTGTAGTSGVKVDIGYATVQVFVASGGTFSQINLSGTGILNFSSATLQAPPTQGDVYSLEAGTGSNAKQFIVRRNGVKIIDWIDSTGVTPYGSSNTSVGFGLAAYARAGGGQNTPPSIDAWSGGDNISSKNVVAGSLPLVNRGDQDAWPRYLCYGPGTFSFGNGPDSQQMINFGPLGDGQIALVTTLPRLRSVVDLSPTLPTQSLTVWQQLLKALIDFATANNVPPLLQQFESFFGIQPPQGALYSLLDGRFTNPIPGKADSEPPVVSHIPVTISGGNSQSKVVAAITPMRKWPL